MYYDVISKLVVMLFPSNWIYENFKSNCDNYYKFINYELKMTYEYTCIRKE